MKGLQAIAVAALRQYTYTTIALDPLDCLSNRLLIGHINSIVFIAWFERIIIWIMEIIKIERSAKRKIIKIN